MEAVMFLLRIRLMGQSSEISRKRGCARAKETNDVKSRNFAMCWIISIGKLIKLDRRFLKLFTGDMTAEPNVFSENTDSTLGRVSQKKLKRYHASEDPSECSRRATECENSATLSSNRNTCLSLEVR